MARSDSSFKSTKKGRYRLSPEEYEIITKSYGNANWFSDHFMRSADSGTKWQNVSTTDPRYAPDRQEAWEKMRVLWSKDGMPDIWVFDKINPPIKYTVLYDPQGEPIFWQKHGWLFLPWGLQFHHAPQLDITIVGGVGSGKTAQFSMSAAVYAATIPKCRVFIIAPQKIQVLESYQYLVNNLEGTPYWDKFVTKAPQTPQTKIFVENDYVGMSSIEFYSMEDDPRKILTLEGDVAYVDQAEKFQDLNLVEQSLGSRLRGSTGGRPRFGKMGWFANSDDNPELWQRYDLAEEMPDDYLSMSPSSFDNPFLTNRQRELLVRRVGGSEDNKSQWLLGTRPVGSGDHFGRKLVTGCISETLTKVIKELQALPEDHPRLKDIIIKEERLLGLYHFELPPEHHLHRDYIVISDPGQGNPPYRNSAAAMVFDVTDFPKQAAQMRAFWWIAGDGSYWPWANAHRYLVEKYRAQGRNGFDATGTQKGFDEFFMTQVGMAAEGIDLSNSGKALALNALKLFMGKELIIFPYIQHLSNQLTNYRLPDNKIKQDLVMTLAMAASWMRRLYWSELDDNSEEEGQPKRADIEVERYERSSRTDRYDRYIEDRR